ncbi:MAG: IMPACT family protein [Halanaerobiales bacterium]
MKDVFYTPAKSIQIINKVKDSKFYGSISRADTESDVKNFIAKIKEMHYDASHNVSAYILGIGDDALKYSDDDGEPAGSSGPPVLQAIEGADLSNAVIVVTRYFGGTKLGIGGLIRAYGETASLAITEAGKLKLSLYYVVKLSIGYQLLGNVMGQIEAFHAEIINTEYSNQGVNVKILMEPGSIEKLNKTLIEKTANKIVFEIIGHKYK